MASSKPPSTAAVLQLLAGAVFGGVISFLAISVGREALGLDAAAMRQELGWIIAGLTLGVWVALALHELGHVAAGLSQGFQVHLFVVGPLRIHRDSCNRLVAAWNRSIQLAGGVASCLPVQYENLARRMAIMVAGGPGASLLAAAALWTLGLALPPGVRWLALTTAFLSFAIAVATLIPMQTASFHSDGARLLMFFRNPGAMARWTRGATLAGFALSPQAPRDWPAAIIEESRQLVDETLDGLSIASLLYYYEMDRGNLEAAGQHLDHFLEHQNSYPQPFRAGLRLEGAWYEGAVRRRPREARKWLDTSSGGLLIEPHTRLRAEGAVLLAEGQTAEALSKMEAARSTLAWLAVPNGMQLVERKMIEGVIPRKR